MRNGFLKTWFGVQCFSYIADGTTVQSLDTPSEEMNAISLNFWLCKFVREVRKNGYKGVDCVIFNNPSVLGHPIL